MMRIALFGFIHLLNEISFGDCVSKHPKPLIITESQIREKRILLEKKHQAAYMENEVIFRNWPEIRENPKHICQGLLNTIFCKKTDLNSVTPGIRKVILNYKQIRDENNNSLTPKRVTALECRLRIPVWRRKFIYFIRSPKSPRCALFLNRIGRRSYNFYITQDICVNNTYPYFRSFIEELAEDKVQKCASKIRNERRQMLLLPNEEIELKRAEFEHRHKEYCTRNTEMCNMWPEVQILPENECQRFLKKMLPRCKELLPTAEVHLVELHYLEMRKSNKETIHSVIVNAIACQFSLPVLYRKHAYFIRAPSFPSCVFYIIRKMLVTEHFYIAEEICDTPSHQTSLYTILQEHIKSFKLNKRRGFQKYDKFEKLQEYENIHYKDYSVKQTEYEEWPELGETNINSYCHKMIENIFSQAATMSTKYNMRAKSRAIILQYATISGLSNETVLPRKVMALKCHMSDKQPPNQFWFIRSPKTNCVYWITRKIAQRNFYYISRECCEMAAQLSDYMK